MKKDMFENRMKRCFFSIKGDCDPQVIIDKLSLTPDCVLMAGDSHPYENGRRVEKNEIIVGYNDLYEKDYNDMLYKTLTPLIPKEELFSRLKEEYGLQYVINVGEEMKDELFVLDGPIASFIVRTGSSRDQSFSFF